MAPSMVIDIAEQDVNVKMEKKKRKKSKDLAVVDEVNAAAQDHVDDSTKKKKQKKKKNNENEGEEISLIQLIAKYLDKRKLHKSLSSFLSETLCESSWKTQKMDLEDIFNQCLNQESENLKKHNVEDRYMEQGKDPLSNDHVNGNNNLRLQEQEVQIKDADKVVNAKVAPSLKGDLNTSGALKQQVSGSDKCDSSCADAQDEFAKSKNKKHKGPGIDNDSDSEKMRKQMDSGKLDKLLEESLELPKKDEKKKKKKKHSEIKDLIDNEDKKISTHRENGNSIEDNIKPSKILQNHTDSGKLDKSLQESLEVAKEEEVKKKKKKKKNSEDKALINNDQQKTSSDKENGNSIKDNSKSSKTLPKQTDPGKLDNFLHESLEVPKEETKKKKKKKKKKSSEDKNLIDNDEQSTSTDREDENSIKRNNKLSKTSNKSKNILEVGESLQEPLEVRKQKRKMELDAEDKDSGDNEKQNNAEKTKKEKKGSNKKCQSPSSNVTNKETTKSSLKDLMDDTDKSLIDATPGKKGVKADEGETNVSSTSKHKSDEPTTAKSFQRVKLEEVEFVDARLQDNSYWAKSGAEIGYGAKAEQVLGQVRGKDFRHEKTKKKRGSYKGGMIDLQSHSIKFSYSDEEE